MEQIFISSLARGEMGPIRNAARQAVEALEMRPVMFETSAASAESPRRALLDRVASCDALLLLLGAEYGEPGERGTSPTEEEFNEARERGISVLALLQGTEREPAQEEFVQRVRGGWEEGHLTADFSDATDVGFAVTKALNLWRRRHEGGDAAPTAQARATTLARGSERPGGGHGGSKLRVVVVPAVSRPLLDALALRDCDLLDDLAAAARSSRLAPQSSGITTDVGRDSIVLQLTGGRGFDRLALHVGFDGSVVGEGAVGTDQLGFGSSVVMADRAHEVITRSLAFTSAVWQRIDSRDEIRDVFVTCAVPEAQYKVYALEPLGNSMSMPMSLPNLLIAPDPPIRARRQDLPSSVERLHAELQRAFELSGAVHPRTETRGAFG